jgi:hypothetical protein
MRGNHDKEQILIHPHAQHKYTPLSNLSIPTFSPHSMPGQLTINPRIAGVSLRVVVVGGGLAGIATAFTLQRAGHNVTVLERSDGKARVSSSFCLSNCCSFLFSPRVMVESGARRSVQLYLNYLYNPDPHRT